MRVLAAAATIVLCLAASYAIGGESAHLPGIPAHTEISKQASGGKPGASGGGNDTCRYAHDNECDEPDIGTGACRANTDFSDCRYIRQGEGDYCRYARDGECDEPNFGTGACPQGSDRGDCGNIAWMRNQNDSCATAFNGVCEEPGHGAGTCAVRTDRSDCRGRNRPMAITDHFFGHDDRVLVPVDQLPWRYIGELVNDAGEACTATLVARDVIVTAAHCINSEQGPNASARFESAFGHHSARTVAYLTDPHYDYRRFTSGNDVDGLDWALLRIDQPLGDQLGFAGVQNLTGQGRAQALAADLMQAGFGWDTGEHLAGNLRCHMVDVHADNTFAHECDTTRGDSGSSFFVRNGNNYDVVGVDSNFRSNRNGPFIYIAVSAAGFQPQLADFAAGRSGIPVRGAAAGKK